MKSAARLSAIALALAVLAAPASAIFAQSTPAANPPKVVTGGDPQPTGEAMPVILILPSLIIL